MSLHYSTVFVFRLPSFQGLRDLTRPSYLRRERGRSTPYAVMKCQACFVLSPVYTRRGGGVKVQPTAQWGSAFCTARGGGQEEEQTAAAEPSNWTGFPRLPPRLLASGKIQKQKPQPPPCYKPAEITHASETQRAFPIYSSMASLQNKKS